MNLNNLQAYELIDKCNLSDISSEGLILRHKKSGARIAIISNDDTNKVFYIAFRTTPEDETGVPHIIEHTVLCGSDKYPVKDPFIELAKGSLNTFLNAMTYPDKTVYPIASYNDQDFKNLMDVYLDAVFHPNITKYEEIFKQEGWHYELPSEDAPLTVNGVVYNEMKGAYSSPDEVLQTAVMESLFPDNTYSRNSGGNPVHIPELTYQAYLDFYHKYYHPSNSYILLYGDMDVEERLNYLDREYLGKYDFLQVDSAIIPQKPFDQVKDMTGDYSIASDDPEDHASYLSYNRVIGNSLDPELYIAFDILDYALVSAPGAPVRQALIDAGIGEDVYGSYESGICQPVFSIIAKNADYSDKEEFLSIISEELKKAAQGLNKESLLAAINSNEFRFREADFGRFPKGLMIGLQCLDSWLFDDRKPFIHIQCLDTYAKLRELVNTDYFEKLVEEWLIDNQHGSTVCIVPKKNKNEEEEKALAQKLQAYKDSLSQEEIKALVKATADLKAYQEAPSSEEDLKKIPLLRREDIGREAMPFENTEDHIGDIQVVRHEVDSSGIHYISFLFDANDVPKEDLGYLGLLSTVLGSMNTDEHTYLDFANEVNIYTGGISFGARLYPKYDDDDQLIMKYEVSVKVLTENLNKAISLAKEVILTTRLDDTQRLKEILAQTKARLQSSLSGGGHGTASCRGSIGFSKSAYYQDCMQGIGFYRTAAAAEKMLAEDPSAVIGKLKELRDRIFAQKRMLISYTGKEDLYLEAKDSLKAMIEAIPQGQEAGPAPEILLTSKNEAFIDASQIQYVAVCGNFKKKGYAYKGTLRLLKMILSFDYLWINVRVKGGAYGVMTSYVRNGDSYFVSYRDPKLKDTISVFEGVPEYVRNFNPDERDMTKYIIGTFGAIDTPMNADDRGRRSMSAWISGTPHEVVQRERNEILDASQQDIRDLADIIEAVLSEKTICVVGNENMIRECSDMFDSVEKLCN